MKNILCICNTFYQLIIAIQLARTLKERDNVYLILSDHSRGAEGIANNISQLSVFKDVFFLKSKVMKEENRGLFHSIIDVFSMITGKNAGFDFLPNQILFDEMIHYNYGIAEYILYSALKRKNTNCICSRFEEGILSYDNEYIGRKMFTLVHIIQKITGIPQITECEKHYYCFNPNAYKGRLQPIKVPSISSNDEELKKILQSVFSVNTEEIRYSHKYIFFSGVYDFEGGEPIKEIELISQIAEIVGKDNIVIKAHPRDDAKRFTSLGIHVDKNSSIPWEVIHLSGNFQHNKFLTSFSGSVLSINMVIDHPSETFFMYPLLNLEGNILAQQSKKSIDMVVNAINSNNGGRWLHIVNDIDEIRCEEA